MWLRGGFWPRIVWRWAVTDLGFRIATRLGHETGYDWATAEELGNAWALLAEERGWTDVEVERLSMDCAAAWIHPDMLRGALVREVEATVAMWRLRDAVVAPLRSLLELMDRQLRRWPWLYHRLGGGR
jgi:hypothetical protein